MVGLVAGQAMASDLEAWLRAKVASQQPAPQAVGAAAQQFAFRPWRERPSTQRVAVPGFAPPTSLAPLVKSVRDAVVGVTTKNTTSTRSTGSGFILTPDGLMVTNDHVVDHAGSITVRLFDGRRFDADLVVHDAQTDLAVLQINDAQGLPTVTFGDSDALEVGDWVVAIGNPFGLETSVTHGLVSAQARSIGVGPFDEFIQTDALINPGNSGGPLFDMHGDVVGVTTAIASQGQGIGFALPINMVKDLLPNLLDDGKAERGWLGLTVHEVDGGPIVSEVFEGSPAAAAGVRVGDRITAVQGRAVGGYQQLLRRVALLGPGTAVTLGLTRKGKPVTVSAELIERPQSAKSKLSRLPEVARGVQLVEKGGAVVIDGVPASLVEVQLGDLVLEVNQRPVQTAREAKQAIDEATGSVLLKLQRGDVVRVVTLP